MFKPTYLYVKTHNKTGLKYFGKTTAKDPHKYKGSGLYWKRHLKIHGNDIITEILGHYSNEEECKLTAFLFSQEHNIVESKEWANLKEERLDGGFDYINENKLHSPVTFRDDPEKRIRATEKSKNWIKENQEEFSYRIKQGMNELYSRGYVKIQPPATEETKSRIKESLKQINHQQGEKNSQYGTCWISNCDLKLSKKIKKSDIIPEGWVKGRNIWLQEERKLLKTQKRKLENDRKFDLLRVKYTEFYTLYKEVGYKSFCEITGYDKTHSTLCCMFRRYVV